MKIGILTSSRADYGIYYSLLVKLYQEPSFDPRLIVFGSHMLKKYGETIRQIEKDGFKVYFKYKVSITGDSPADISLAMSKTIKILTKCWKNNHFDLVFALGDRYEMFAAVSSTVPFNIPVAHIHGGETTLGVIDNSFRHSITSMAGYHFTCAEEYRQRVAEIKGSEKYTYNVGALSIDYLKSLKFYSLDELKLHYSLDLCIPTILVTFHPETINFLKNTNHINELVSALTLLTHYQIIITLPNADTYNHVIREALVTFAKKNKNVHCVDSLGSRAYLSCMKYCSFMLGNTSSGFIEASYFGKPVINIGNRQTGRIITRNIYSVPIEKKDIIETVKAIKTEGKFTPNNIYGTGDAADKIIEILKKNFAS